MKQARTKMIDPQTLSPKVSVPTLALLGVGALLMILDILGVIAIEDEIWITVLGAGGAVFPIGYSARPGAVIPDPVDRDELKQRARSSWGHSLIEVLVTLFVAILVVIVLLALLDRL